MNNISNTLYVMYSYMTAMPRKNGGKAKVIKRYGKGSISTPHGFISNHIWNSGLTAGDSRRARKVRELYPEAFEIITKKEYYDTYYPNTPINIRTNYEMSRIKENWREYWRSLVHAEIEKYEERHGKFKL